MRRFVEQAAQGTTHDQPESRLPAIGRAWFDYHWHEPNAGLAAQPPVGVRDPLLEWEDFIR